MTLLYSALICSTYLIISMTFERFYSIIKPHKAASFNTVKRAKITIFCIILCSILFSTPHIFFTVISGDGCVPYVGGFGNIYGLLYYWISLIVLFVFPFISLLIMNSVIIHTLRKRPIISSMSDKCQVQGQNENHQPKLKISERNVFYNFTVGNICVSNFVHPVICVYFYEDGQYQWTPVSTAIYHLFYQITGNMSITNCGINFFLYILSGHKFRTDLLKLFKCNGRHQANQSASNSSVHVTHVTTWGTNRVTARDPWSSFLPMGPIYFYFLAVFENNLSKY